jgi:hypothetical protein
MEICQDMPGFLGWNHEKTKVKKTKKKKEKKVKVKPTA